MTTFTREQLEEIANLPTQAEARQILLEQDKTRKLQNEVWRAQEAEEVFSKKFKESWDEFSQQRDTLDADLRHIRSLLAEYVQKRIRLANGKGQEVANNAKYLAGAAMRILHPDGSEDWRIGGNAEQLIMNENGDLPSPMVLPTPPQDDALMANLIYLIAGETGERIRGQRQPARVPDNLIETHDYRSY